MPPSDHPIPSLARRPNGSPCLLVDGTPFIALGAELRNSSASSRLSITESLDAVAALHCNAFLAPVYWELIEPEEGRFDFSLVDALLEGARARHMRWIPLWFGSWKNAESTYVPAWVKQDTSRFPRAHPRPGTSCRTLSAFHSASRDADAAAFARLMAYLRDHDPERTVIMVQVENEAGLLGGPRDQCPAAEAAFRQPVPASLAGHLDTRRAALHPDLLAAWTAAGCPTRGTWSDLFGPIANEAFMAWHIAAYIQTIAAAGKAEYPLPMFANAWLNYGNPGAAFGGSVPGEQYPCGGPVARVCDIWRAAAQDIDIIAPDIYAPDFQLICSHYASDDNPLLIPEALPAAAHANVFWAIAQHAALCFAPFGVDGAHPWGCDLPTDAPGLRESYALLSEMLPFLEPHLGAPTLRGLLPPPKSVQTLSMGGFLIEVQRDYHSDDAPQAAGLLLQTGPSEFFVAGRGFDVRFSLPPDAHRQVELLSVDDGQFRNGQWTADRRLNGDDTQGGWVRLQSEVHPAVRHVALHTYA